MKKVLQFIKERQYIIYFAISLLILDLYLRYLNIDIQSYKIINPIPNLFSIVWIAVFILLIYNINNKRIKAIVTLLLLTIFTMLSLTNIIFSRLFSKFFSFKDILYAGEGIEFINSIFGYIKLEDLIIFMTVFCFIALSIWSYRYIKKENKRSKMVTSMILLVIIIFGIVSVQEKIGEATDPSYYTAFYNKRNIYNQFNDTKRSLMLCGLYEYSIRDFYLTFIKQDKIDYQSYYEEINEYIETNDKKVSEYNSIFKDKNLILVMLEDIDTWMLNEKSMPTLYEMQQKSINFTEHYAVNYASGYTFNSEFIANTGIIPNITALRTSYSYNKNNYDYALATLFKNAGYITNSIHKNKGQYYNRDNMHIAWGYSKHFDFAKLNTNGENMDLDSSLVKNNIDKIIYTDKFMTFFITYSAHMPFNYDKIETKRNIKYIKEQFDSDNEEYLCALSQAKETDDAIKILIEELENQGKMEDTVLVFFSDHYAYSMNKTLVSELKNESDKNLLTKTPFFIYNNGNFVETIDKVNSTVDILPTLADLFGLDYNPNVYSGYSIFDKNCNGIVVFRDGTWYDGEIYYKVGETDVDSEYVKRMNEYAKKFLTIGGRIIESDYFRKFNLNDLKNK